MNEESRPVKAAPEDLAMAAGSVSKSTVSALCYGVISGKAEPHMLPAPMHDLWRDGFSAGALAMLPRLHAAEHDANQLYYALHNPEEVRAEHERTMRLFDTAKGREADKRRRAALDVLESTDLFEYRRVAHLGLTDRPAYIAALEAVSA